MSLVKSIENQIQNYQNTKNTYENKPIDFLPSNHNMSSKKAYRVEVCALYIELRGANNLDSKDWEGSIHLIHQLAMEPIYQILEEFEGKIQSTPGNGVLALWTSNKSNINKAVEAALTLNWLLKVKFQVKNDYPKFDYGIAIHHGAAFAIKTRVPGGEYDEEEIKFISPIINITQSMSNQLAQSKTIGISHDIYSRLYDESISIKKSFVLIPYQKNIWDDDKVKYNERSFNIKTTAHHMDFEEQSIDKF